MQPNQYPQQQPYPPQQGYAQYPQQQPYGPPQGQPYPYPAPPQQYAPAPQYAPPMPPAAPAAPVGNDDFGAPDKPQATITRPRLLDFGRENRLVYIKPTKIERDVPNTKGKPGDKQDRMTADVVILDGAPFQYGGQPENGKPHTLQATIPHEVPSMYISSAGVISQCERRLNNGGVLGRLGIVSLENGNTAYRIADPTDADIATCREYLVNRQMQQVQPPVQAQPVQQPQQQYMTQPAPVPPYAGAPAAPAAPQSAPPVPAGYGPPPLQLDINTPPPGADPAWWAAQPAEYRQMIVGSMQQRPGV